jgi:hypothetical protein
MIEKPDNFHTRRRENASNGTSLNANDQIPNSVVQQWLGRLPAGASARRTRR